jgi:hypothetical protein
MCVTEKRGVKIYCNNLHNPIPCKGCFIGEKIRKDIKEANKESKFIIIQEIDCSNISYNGG